MGTQEHAPATAEPEVAPAAHAASAPLLAPGGPAIATVMSLQRRAGNAAVAQMLARREAPIENVWVPGGMRTDNGAAVDHWQMRHLRHQGPLAVRGAGENETGLDADDVRQGAVGDCFFLSPLMAITRINPRRIRNMIRGPIGQTTAGANVYEVTFHTADGRSTYRVDDRFITGPTGRPIYAQYGDMSAIGPEIWVMVMEKAWAAMRGNSYQATHFGMMTDSYRALLDSDTDWHQVSSLNAAQILQVIQDGVIAGKPVCCQTVQTLNPAISARAAALGKVITPAHAYNVSGCHTGAQTIDVANPHGINHLPNLGVSDFRLFFDWIAIAEDSAR